MTQIEKDVFGGLRLPDYLHQTIIQKRIPSNLELAPITDLKDLREHRKIEVSQETTMSVVEEKVKEYYQLYDIRPYGGEQNGISKVLKFISAGKSEHGSGEVHLYLNGSILDCLAHFESHGTTF